MLDLSHIVQDIPRSTFPPGNDASLELVERIYVSTVISAESLLKLVGELWERRERVLLWRCLMSTSQLPHILVGESLCGGLHDGAEGKGHACTSVCMMTLAYCLDSCPPMGFLSEQRPTKRQLPQTWLSASAFLPLVRHVWEPIDLPGVRRLPGEVRPQVHVLALIWSGSLTTELYGPFLFCPMNT